MRIAIPVSEGKLDPHFGHCRQFALVDVDRVLKLKPGLSVAIRMRAMLLAAAEKVKEIVVEMMRPQVAAQSIFGKLFGISTQGLAAGITRLAGGQSQFDNPALRKQRHIARAGQQAVPVKTGLQGQYLTLRCLHHPQWFIATDKINRSQLRGEVSLNFFGS